MTNRQVLWLLSALLAPSLVAAQVPSNYYAAASDQGVKDHLRTVEAYHLKPDIRQAIQAKHYVSVWGDLDFVLRYFPNHPRALLLMSEVCHLWRDPRCNPESYFDKAIAMTPDNPTIQIAKGIYLQRGNRLDEAIESFKQALLSNPNSINAHYNLGLAYLAQKQYGLANEHAQQAYSLETSLPAGLRNKLVAAGAWKPIEFKPAEQTQRSLETAQPQQVKALPGASQADSDDGKK